MVRRRRNVVNAVRAHERPSFADVAEDCLDAVYRYLVLFTRDRSIAEDLAAETFERAFRAWRSFDPKRGTPLAWLCAIARRTALDHFRSSERRRRREQSYALSETAAGRDTDFGEGFSPELERALAGLSAADRELLALRVVLEVDADATSRLLGISRTACSTRLNRALQRLEERLETNALA
jgi:RNA polymerase sigma factor (sigma-70 family)